MARYLGVAAGKWKYWEIHVDGAAVTVDEGALGTLGKRSVHTFPDEAAARRDAAAREKKVVAKGFSLDAEPTNLAAGLFAAVAPCVTEAQRGDPERAAVKALAALQARSLSDALDIGYCALILARRGALDQGKRVIEAFDARRDAYTGDRRAGHRALVAATQIPLGRSELFDALAEEALEGLPEWRAPRTWPPPIAREGVALAEALLDHGRREDARALFGALGYFGLDALLARGQLGWYDEVAPGSVADSTTRDRLRLARATAEGSEALARTFVAMADEDLGAMNPHAAEGRLHWLASALRDAPDRHLAASLAEALRRATHRCHEAHAQTERWQALWIAVAELSRLGGDVTEELSWASSPSALGFAASVLLWHAPDAAVMPRVAERLRALPDASAPGDGGWGVQSVVVRARGGEVMAPDTLRSLAALTRRDFLLLGDLAAVALAQGDRALAWELLGLAKSRDLSGGAGAARRRLASWALLGPYKTLCDAVPPVYSHERRDESLLIAAVIERA